MRKAFIASFLALLISPWAHAQQAGQPVQQAGIAPDWEVRRMVEEAAHRTALLSTVVDQIHAEQWPASAQSERASVRSVREQMAAVQGNFAALKEQPDRLSVLLEAVVRLDTIVRQVDALRPAVARYQDPGVAIDLDRLLAGPSASREKLFNQASDLARFVEDQLRFLRQDLAQCEQTPRERLARPQKR